MSDEISFVATDPETGIPEPVSISRSALAQALASNPTIIIDSLRSIIGGTQGGGGASGGSPGAGRGPLPTSTPVTQMLPPELAQQLSPAARRLTKGDLLALGGWDGRTSAQQLGLTVKDIQTIRTVFAERLRPSTDALGGAAALDVSCCCCTPCCCAAAEMEPLRAVA